PPRATDVAPRRRRRDRAPAPSRANPDASSCPSRLYRGAHFRGPTALRGETPRRRPPARAARPALGAATTVARNDGSASRATWAGSPRSNDASHREVVVAHRIQRRALAG